MIYNFSKIKISTGIKKALFLLISFFIYGFIYFLFCDDHEFGGINILQDEIKKKFVDKYITKVKDGNINSYTKGKLGEKIQTGDVSHKKDKSLTTHLLVILEFCNMMDKSVSASIAMGPWAPWNPAASKCWPLELKWIDMARPCFCTCKQRKPE